MTLQNVREAYNDATGSWTGCDWTTDAPNLEDKTPEEARVIAAAWDRVADGEEVTGEDELPKGSDTDSDCSYRKNARQWAEEWSAGAEQLEAIQADAKEAEEAAKEALAAAEAGDWSRALRWAKKADTLESTYGSGAIWSQFLYAVQDTVNDLEADAEAEADAELYAEAAALEAAGSELAKLEK